MPPRSPFVRNQGKFCLWSMKSWALESEIQLKESGIPLKMESGINVPLKKKIRSPVTGIWNPWLGIQNLRLSWIEKKKRRVSSLVSLLSLLCVRSHYLQWFSGPLDKILLVCNTIANGLTGQVQYYIGFYR